MTLKVTDYLYIYKNVCVPPGEDTSESRCT